MSVGVTCDESKIQLLDELVNASMWTGAEMLLSEADITPDRATVLADLDAFEPTFSGYSRQPIVYSGVPTIDGSGIATDIADEVTFSNLDVTDSPTIYTWGIVSSDGTKLIEAGRWTTPFVIEATTGTFPTTPRTRLSGE